MVEQVMLVYSSGIKLTQQRINCFSGHAPGPVMFARTFGLRCWDGLKDQLLFREPPRATTKALTSSCYLCLLLLIISFCADTLEFVAGELPPAPSDRILFQD